MKIKKYRAADSQQAMRLIRAEQGPDASILTCYQVPEGIEFVVALDAQELVDVDQPARVSAPAATTLRRQKIDDSGDDHDMLTLRQELGSMRSLLERHLHRLAVREPQPATAGATLTSQLATLGISAVLQQRLRALLPDTAGREQLSEALHTSLADVACGYWPQQGITALVGPSGAGKSQLLATLALQHVLTRSRQPLYLVSIDQQRFGAREQLLALGRVLGLPVHFAGSEADLAEALSTLPADARVLLDTAGVDHGDGAGMTALAGWLDRAGISHRVLVLPLDQSEAVLQATLMAYAAITPSGVVTTRLDNVLPGVPASWLCQGVAGLPWLGASAGRDPATSWRAADIERLVETLLQAWPEPEPAVVPVAPAVSRWSWSSQRISA